MTLDGMDVDLEGDFGEDWATESVSYPPRSLTFSHLKNGAWKTNLSFWVCVTFQGANC